MVTWIGTLRVLASLTASSQSPSQTMPSGGAGLAWSAAAATPSATVRNRAILMTFLPRWIFLYIYTNLDTAICAVLSVKMRTMIRRAGRPLALLLCGSVLLQGCASDAQRVERVRELIRPGMTRAEVR